MPVKASDNTYKMVFELYAQNPSSTQNLQIDKYTIKTPQGRVIASYTPSQIESMKLTYPQFSTKSIVLGHDGDAGNNFLIFYAWVNWSVNEALPKSLDVEVSAHYQGELNNQVTFTNSVPVSSMKPLSLPFPIQTPKSLAANSYWYAVAAVSNTSDHRITFKAKDDRLYTSERFAVDWELIGENHHLYKQPLQAPITPQDNQKFWDYGLNEVAVSDGQIVEVVDNQTANEPYVYPQGQKGDALAGNFVVLKFEKNNQTFYAMYAHMQHGSIKVKVGQQVKQGDVLGSLGNTGNANVPHLHFQVCINPAEAKAGNYVFDCEGYPFTFKSMKLYGQAPKQNEATDEPMPVWHPHAPVTYTDVTPLYNQIIRV